MGCENKKYCLDTSGLSNPLETMPEDIHSIIWAKVINIVVAGKFAATKEIYDELTNLPGMIGACLKDQPEAICLEVGEEGWPWEDYLANVEAMRETHKSVISEYNNDRKHTVCLNDISIIALAKTLGLPVMSMESNTQTTGTINSYGNQSTYSGQSTTNYSGGYPIIGGRHQQAITIRMFRDGDPGSERAVNAKQVLGPEWQKEMETSSRGTC